MNTFCDQWKQLLWLGFGTTITLVLLSWVLRDIHWVGVGHSLQRADWGWLMVGWCAYLISYGVRAHRWGMLLEEQGFRSSFQQRLTATFVGFGANSVLPASLGEFIRAGLLNQSAGVPLEASLGSILAERMLDIGVVLLLWVVPLSLQWVPTLSGFNTTLIVMLCCLLFALWSLCLLGAKNPEGTVRRLEPILSGLTPSKLQRRLRNGLLNFLTGLTVLGKPRRCLALLMVTLTAWLLNGVTYWTGLVAFNELAPGFWGALFIQSGAALAIAIPSTPGYIGPFEASLQVLLGLYRMPSEVILSYTLVLRFLMYVTIPMISIVLIFKLGLNFSQLAQPSIKNSKSAK